MPHIQWQPSGYSHCILAVGMLLGLLIIFRIRNSTSIGVRVIAAIRILVIVAIILVGYMPMIVQYVPAASSKQIALVIDNSRSMTTTDSKYQLAELMRIAQFLGMVDRQAAPSPIEPLLRDLDKITAAADEPGNQKSEAPLNESIRPILAKITPLAAYRPMLKLAVSRLQGMIDHEFNRADISRAIEQLRTEMNNQLNADLEETVNSDEDFREITNLLDHTMRFDLARRSATMIYSALSREMQVEVRDLKSSLPSSAISYLEADENETPLLKSMRDLVEHEGTQGLDGIILLTDGKSTESRQFIPPALITAGVPVYPVLISPSAGQPSVRIMGIDAPGIVLQGEKIDVFVRIRPRHAEGLTANVRLSDRQVSLNRSVVLGNADITIRFEYQASRSGNIMLDASVDAFDADTQSPNNISSCQISVVPEKLSVSMLGDSRSADFDLLKNILRQSPWVRFTENEIDSDADVVVISSPEKLNSQQVSQISTVVLEKGKSLIFSGCSATELNTILLQQPWQKLLQISAERGPFRDATDELLPSPTQLILYNNSLSGHPGFTSPDHLKLLKLRQQIDLSRIEKNGFSILNDQSNNRPLLFGLSGRKVVIVGVTGFADWPAEDSSRFWSRLVRGLTDWPLKTRDRGLQLTADYQQVDQGDGVALFASTSAPSAGSVQLLQKLSDQSVESLPIFETYPGTGRWFTRVIPRLAGDCTFTFHQGSSEVSQTINIKSDPDIEMRDTSPDDGLMKRLASATGGRMFSIDQMDQIRDVLSQRTSTQTRRIERNIWCSQYLYLAIAGLLGLEWSLRKLMGMA